MFVFRASVVMILFFFLHQCNLFMLKMLFNTCLGFLSCNDFMSLSGIDVEGILRTNGSSKLLDKLRSSYNTTGTGDVRAADPVTVGGLLKVFLLELPDGLIPQHFTAQFVNAQDS